VSQFGVIENTSEKLNLPLEVVLELESLRADCLDMLLCNEPLEATVSYAITKVEAILHIDRLAVFAICPTTGNLLLTANPSLPSAFTEALCRYKIISAEDHCGQAYYTGKVASVFGFLSQPRHADLRRISRHLKINECISLPLNGFSGETLGALDYYKDSDSHLTDEKLTTLTVFSQSLGRILERCLLQAKTERANRKIKERLEEQQSSLEEAHFMLTKALSQRDEVRAQLVEMEKMASMGTMVSSMTHEMTSPLGVSLTAITHLQSLQKESRNALDNQKLKRSQLERFYLDCEDACKIAERNLIRASNVVDIFKKISVDQHSEEQRVINLAEFVSEILLSLKPELKRTKHVFCLGIDADLVFQGYPGALGQILINLIMNSLKHAYSSEQAGKICIFANLDTSLSGQTLEIVYSDDGKGMDDYTRQNIYRPFFTLAKKSGGTGLGMHICYNLAVNILNGSIQCESEVNKGTRFTLRMPVNVV
jgi:signal transduction histidine kinase